MQTILTHPAPRTASAVLAFALAAFIAWNSLVPPADVPGPQLWDKLLHFLAYGALSGPAALWLGPRRLLASLALVIGFGICLEFAQHMAGTGRVGSGLDALANALGAGLGTGMVGLLRDRS